MRNKILVCDRAGQPHHWAPWEDGICLKVKNLVSYEIGDPAVYSGGTSRMTGLRSTVDVGQIIFLKEVLKYDARTPPLTNQNLFKRDLHICGYCARRYPETKLSRDHIHPVSKGGQNVWMNVVTACKACNSAKSNMSLKEAGMELVYVPYVPSHAEKLLLQERNVIFDQMEYLKGFLPEHSRILKSMEILGIN